MIATGATASKTDVRSPHRRRRRRVSLSQIEKEEYPRFGFGLGGIGHNISHHADPSYKSCLPWTFWLTVNQ
jgi:hypothetical protein